MSFSSGLIPWFLRAKNAVSLSWWSCELQPEVQLRGSSRALQRHSLAVSLDWKHRACYEVSNEICLNSPFLPFLASLTFLQPVLLEYSGLLLQKAFTNSSMTSVSCCSLLTVTITQKKSWNADLSLNSGIILRQAAPRLEATFAEQCLCTGAVSMAVLPSVLRCPWEPAWRWGTAPFSRLCMRAHRDLHTLWWHARGLFKASP